MPRFPRRCCVLVISAFLTVQPVHAQSPLATDRDLPRAEARPRTRAEYLHAEALTLFSVGLLHEKANRLVQAVNTLEEATKLEPEAAPIHKALIPLYLALDRGDDALAACKRTLELTPYDAPTWFLYARQLKALNRNTECLDALAHGAACPGLKDAFELHMQMCFDLGMLAETMKEDDKALAAFKEVASLLGNPAELFEEGIATREDIDSQACDVYERMAKLCLRGKKFDEAVAYFAKAQDKALDKQPGRAKRICLNLAQVLVAKEDFAGALKPLNEYLQGQPQDAEPYKLKTEILAKMGSGKEIVPTLEKYAQADANNDTLHMLLADECRKAGQSSKAEKIYRTLADKRPSPEVYRGLFRVMKADGMSGTDAILNEMNTVIGSTWNEQGEVAPGKDTLHAQALLGALRDEGDLVSQMLPQAVARLGNRANPLHPRTRSFLAVLAGRTKKREDAEKLYRSCLDDVLEGRRGNEPEIYSGLLRLLWEGHKYEAIVEVCKLGLEKAQVTNRVVFQLDLARALVLLDKTNEAVEAANAAVDLAGDRERVQCRRLRASILAEAEQYEPAIADCLDLLKESTNPGETHEIRYTLSNVYSQAKQMTKAEEQLELILKDDPADATACNDLGYLWADQNKNLPEAERLIRKALELDKKQKSTGDLVTIDGDRDNAAYLDSLGWVLFRRGKLAEAIEQLEKASSLEQGANDPVVWDHLGDVFSRLNELAKAQSAWKKATACYEDAARRRPKDDRYKEIQQKLQTAEQHSRGTAKP
ncbi:MAG TPA: tetratricopeptide repeat protein [Gemmataceae bacterium]